ITVTPALSARMFSASLKSTPSFRITKANMSPPVPQAPKQCQLWRSGKTKNEGVFSEWKGHTAGEYLHDVQPLLYLINGVHAGTDLRILYSLFRFSFSLTNKRVRLGFLQGADWS